MHTSAFDHTTFTRDDLYLGPFFVQGIREWWALSIASLRGLPRSETPVRRFVWLAVVLPVGWGLLCLHWLCFWLDDFFFPAARSVALNKPVFVLGPPRCGTTHLHRVLALESDQVVTSSAWEVLLAPTVLQKKFLRGVLSVDRMIGSPLCRLVRWVERRCARGFDHTHPGSLGDPEEDYFYLLPIMACSGLALAFPDWKGFRSLVPGLKEDSVADRKRALQFYRFCLRKQLYVGGPGGRLLSKNASFSSWMDVLPDVFPDAQWVSCMRDPANAVPSMQSTADAAMKDFFLRGREAETREWLKASMEAHYRMTATMATRLPPSSFQVVCQRDLKENLYEVLTALVETFDWNPSASVWHVWREKAEASRGYQSSHHYASNPDEFGVGSWEESFPLTPATVLRHAQEKVV